LAEWVDYFQRVAALPLAPEGGDVDLVEALNASGFATIGTPDMAVAQIQRLVDQSGGFGTFLFMAHEWADREATIHSYELFSRYVAPLFQGSTPSLVNSRDWAAANRPQFIGAAGNAIMGAIQEHQQEKAAKAEKADA
jgi:limonene 1,2-monooxygenase